MDKAAIIDLGTNTFHLMLVEKTGPDDFQIIEKITNPVKLGQGGVHKRTLTPEAFARGMKALEAYAEVLKNYPSIPVFAFGTSALRDAENASEFVQLAKEKTGIDIEVISGEKEANLIFEGVKLAFPSLPSPTLILDIGGGSVEIIMTNSGDVDFAHSFNIGASRLLGQFEPKDPITTSEVLSIKDYLKKELQTAIENANHLGPINLIGSSGSFETFADVLYERKQLNSNPREQTYYPLPTEELLNLFNELMKSNYAQRESMPGMAIMRVEMIVMAVLITQVILENTQVSKIWLSDYAMKEGMINSILSK